MNVQLPKNRRGVTWFWHMLGDGENGAQLVARLPYIPKWVSDEQVYIWTKVTAHNKRYGLARAIVLLRTVEGTTVCGAVIDRDFKVIHTVEEIEGG